ncbi:alpha/beta hydrolase [Alicyclobacillus acidiphilus]|uniref:alpha/beta hydrolase n=1 Tax=Alicyclobacillus acidiphilus TaxID=182455 RepID=UPI00082DCC5F|nr:alpha/beta fold hydrolase [Alicyclobacillus acidiphilus]
MNVQREVIQGDGYGIPSVWLKPLNPVGASVIVHGYGGSKEEQLGLAWRVAEAGLVVCCLDLRGHGENVLPLDRDVLLDVDLVVNCCRRFGKVVSIGHSLGGRLALLSSADFSIAISPALNQVYGEQTQNVLSNLRSYRVREEYPMAVFDVLRELPSYQYDENRPTSIIFGSRDVPEIVKSCTELKALGVPVKQIEEALHSDTYLLQATFDEVGKSIDEWFD